LDLHLGLHLSESRGTDLLLSIGTEIIEPFEFGRSKFLE
jgi:hypothetical protein